MRVRTFKEAFDSLSDMVAVSWVTSTHVTGWRKAVLTTFVRGPADCHHDRQWNGKERRGWTPVLHVKGFTLPTAKPRATLCRVNITSVRARGIGLTPKCSSFPPNSSVYACMRVCVRTDTCLGACYTMPIQKLGFRPAN